MPEALQMLVYLLAFVIIPGASALYLEIRKRRGDDHGRFDEGVRLSPGDRFYRDEST
jgi:hypothetical protein